LNASRPHASIIILTYNGMRFIDGLVASLHDQSYPGDRMEIIVVDNGSGDGTAEYIQNRFPDVECLALDQNLGYSAGNNVGYTHARHELLVFLNQDTLCHHGLIEGLINQMQADEHLAACAANIIPTDPAETTGVELAAPIETLTYCDLAPFGYGRYHQKKAAYTDTLLVSGCAFIIRRAIVAQMGYLFDERIRMYAEDTDLSLRVLNCGKRVGAVRDAIVFHLHGSDNKPGGAGLRKTARALINRVYAFMKNMRRTDFLLFFPLMLVGGSGKIFELNLPWSKKLIFFLPFSILSTSMMLVTLIIHFDRFFRTSPGPAAVGLKMVMKHR